MTRAFAWFMLALSALRLILGLSNFETTKPAELLLWAVVAAAAAYSLFKPKRT